MSEVLLLIFFFQLYFLMFQFCRYLTFPNYSFTGLNFVLYDFFLLQSLFRCMGCEFNSFISDCALNDLPKNVQLCVSIY